MTNDAAVAIKRYAPNLGIGDTFVCMQPEIRGRWVEYGDHVDVVAELRAEIERAKQLIGEGILREIDEKNRAEAAERRVAELTEIIDRVARCSYSVCTRIDIRGHRWSEAYLEQVLPDILAALTKESP